MEISNKRCIQILKLLLKNKECMTGDNLAVQSECLQEPFEMI